MNKNNVNTIFKLKFNIKNELLDKNREIGVCKDP